jgi:hypothetical protein
MAALYAADHKIVILLQFALAGVGEKRLVRGDSIFWGWRHGRRD